MIKLYWGEGFSLSDLRKYAAGQDLHYTMKKLNIPFVSRDYGHILKLSDPEYNARLTREMTEKRLAAGMNICGITEHAPSPREAASRMNIFEENEMTSAITAATAMAAVTILRLGHMSAIGTTSSNPAA